jgi:pSer/pThr/pTyr-binding forkhead associated (FHA) protein
MPGSWIIGKNSDSDYVINERPVSGRHCKLSQDESGIFIEDLGSTNGTFVNGERIEAPRRHPLSASDRVNLGTHAIEAAELISFVGRMNPPELVYGGGELILGRADECNVVVAYPTVSSRHARIYRLGDRSFVEDLGSANGTFVNDDPVRGPRAIVSGDRLSLASRTFVFKEDLPISTFAAQTLAEPIAPAIVAEQTAVGLEFKPDGAKLEFRPGWLAALLLQAPVLGLVVAGVAWLGPPGQSLAVLLFGLVLAALWFGLSDAVVGESLAIKIPGQPLNGMPGTLWGGRLLALAGLAVVQCLLAWAMAMVAGRITSNGTGVIGFMLLPAAVGLAIGTLVLAVAPDRLSAFGCIAGLLALAWVAGGMVRPVHEMPSWVRPIAALTPSRWAFEGVLLLAVGEQPPADGGQLLTEAFFPAETTRTGILADGLALVMMLVGLVALAVFVKAPSPSARGS